MRRTSSASFSFDQLSSRGAILTFHVCFQGIQTSQGQAAWSWINFMNVFWRFLNGLRIRFLLIRIFERVDAAMRGKEAQTGVHLLGGILRVQF